MFSMRRAVFISSLLVGVLHANSVLAQDLPVEKMREAISKGVDYLISRQEADGSWKYKIDWAGNYEVGMTSLCTLALAHTRLPKTTDAVHKGMSYVTQHVPEPMTYTTGLVSMLLFENGGNRYQKLIDAYGKMTVLGQKRDGIQEGSWTYQLVDLAADTGQEVPDPPRGRSDHSNSQFGVLGLWFAQRSGYQVPEIVWKRVKAYYEANQNQDGGWGYTGPAYNRSSNQPISQSYMAMTAASTVSLLLADEALISRAHRQCATVPENRCVEAGMQWIGRRLGEGADPYTWYAVERVAIMSGRSEFGGKDWMKLGAESLIRNEKGVWGERGRGDGRAGTSFAVLFLARALEPIIINKLKRAGDWNNDVYDIKHLTEYISIKFQYPKQWRIVTLEAPVEHLLRVPILYINGHDKLVFTDDEKKKLKEYVDRGGTIFAMACCSKKPFDKSFRELVSELWPDLSLQKLPKSHYIYNEPRPLRTKPTLEGMALEAGQGRLGVIYSPNDLCCRWHTGGERAGDVLDVGANIYFYVSTVAIKQGAVREGYHVDTSLPEEAKKPDDPRPAQPEKQPDETKLPE